MGYLFIEWHPVSITNQNHLYLVYRDDVDRSYNTWQFLSVQPESILVNPLLAPSHDYGRLDVGTGLLDADGSQQERYPNQLSNQAYLDFSADERGSRLVGEITSTKWSERVALGQDVHRQYEYKPSSITDVSVDPFTAWHVGGGSSTADQVFPS